MSQIGGTYGEFELSRQDWRRIGIAMGIMVLWNGITWGFPFFWDTILNSRIAHWYVDSNMGSWTVPESLDAGHPPFFSRYLAMIWTVFGKSLAISHIAMLPFLLTIVVQVYKLGKRCLKPEMLPWVLLVLCLEPTFLAQSSMITPDIALICFYLLGLNAILEGKRFVLGAAMVCMAAMTFRGILIVPALFLSDVALGYWQGKRKPDWRKILPYLPVSILVALWLYIHYKAVGWLLSPPAETYGAHREMVGLSGIVRNIAITGWRWLDYGRVAVWLFVGVAALWTWRKGLLSHKMVRLMVFMGLPAIWLTLLFVPFSNPIGHRYYTVCYLILGIITLGFVQEIKARVQKLVLSAGMALVLISGHFWIYPDHIAQGWDASLAHVRYFGLRNQMDQYVLENEISMSDVCSDFPLLSKTKYTHVALKASPANYVDKFEIGFNN
ncbi:MAG: hypothetical protein AAF570_21410, partial [Bacteroidota bacterium]